MENKRTEMERICRRAGHKNCKQVWKTIRNLDGRVTQRKENEVLVVEGKAYVEDKEKAKQFAKVYKNV